MNIKELKASIIEMLDGYPVLRRGIAYPVRKLRYMRKKPAQSERMRSDYFSNADFQSAGPNTFFGYYDISPVLSSCYLFHELIDADTVQVKAARLDAGRIKVLGASKCWSYQQGSMAQWLPSKKAAVFNCEDAGVLGAKVVSDDQTQFHPYPVELVADDGWFSINFKRLTHSEYGYGYPKKALNFDVDQDAKSDGIWFYQPKARRAELVVKLSQLDHGVPGIKAEFINHLSLSRDGSYLIFIHRLITTTGRRSRLYILDRVSGQVKLILDEGFVSHYCWDSETSFIIYARIDGRKGYFKFDVASQTFASLVEGKLDGFGDGHPTVSPDRKFAITDTYPDKDNRRHLILLNMETGQFNIIASFWVPFAFSDYRRCDLHPRWSSCGNYIFFDSAHTGVRELYYVEFSKISSSLA